MAEGEITAEGCNVVLAPVESASGSVTMGGTIATAQDEATAAEIARRCRAYPLLLKSAEEALTWIEGRSKGAVLDVKDSLRAAINVAKED